MNEKQQISDSGVGEKMTPGNFSTNSAWKLPCPRFQCCPSERHADLHKASFISPTWHTRQLAPSRNIEIGGTGRRFVSSSVGRHFFRQHRYPKKGAWVRQRGSVWTDIWPRAPRAQGTTLSQPCLGYHPHVVCQELRPCFARASDAVGALRRQHKGGSPSKVSSEIFPLPVGPRL